MTAEFLFFADLVLLLRLWLLLADLPVDGRRWLAKGLIELLALGLFIPNAFLAGAAATVVASNAAAAWGEKRGGDRNAWRLLLGVVTLAVLSVCFSRAAEIHFRLQVLDWGQICARWSVLGAGAARLLESRSLTVLCGVLLAANEANLLIRWVLGRLQLKPGNALTNTIDASEYNRGRVIGVLERVLIFFFVLSGQFGAVGFTLAAKGFTRFKELENRSFAEYVLIGTLLSSSLAMLAAGWVRLAW